MIFNHLPACRTRELRGWGAALYYVHYDREHGLQLSTQADPRTALTTVVLDKHRDLLGTGVTHITTNEAVLGVAEDLAGIAQGKLIQTGRSEDRAVVYALIQADEHKHWVVAHSFDGSYPFLARPLWVEAGALVNPELESAGQIVNPTARDAFLAGAAYFAQLEKLRAEMKQQTADSMLAQLRRGDTVHAATRSENRERWIRGVMPGDTAWDAYLGLCRWVDSQPARRDRDNESRMFRMLLTSPLGKVAPHA